MPNPLCPKCKSKTRDMGWVGFHGEIEFRCRNKDCRATVVMTRNGVGVVEGGRYQATHQSDATLLPERRPS